MFFVLHTNTSGQSIHHHEHSHSSKYEHLDDRNYRDKQVINKDESFVIEIVSGQDLDSKQNKSLKNINIQAAIIHVIGDFVQSVGVLLAAILIKVKVIQI
jgi:zinc transporter 2